MQIGRAQLPVPGGGQAPTTPGDMAALALAVDKRLVHPVDDAADRDATFGDADPGTVTVSVAGTVWVKVIDGTWITAHEEPEAWRNLPLVAGYTGGEESPKIRRVGKQVWIRGRVERTDGGLITSSGDIKIAQVPDDCIPKALASGGAGQSILGDLEIGLGRVEVLPIGWEKPSGGPGSVIWYSQEAPGSPWVGVDLQYWTD
ncbi:hypothetical protein [Streptomyces flaveolus]|jgi:hypothetical protein|uniref:hypothetical protein n=1 Tax=Streptomyces flaveolus TaxID=67297 RepID=UPI001671862E|nr:hypothetical protein [Streptomyces flaveolus]GGQ81362.1 hypothetical protein GCM10010216_49030 [Streptomyces flaveolus]